MQGPLVIDIVGDVHHPAIVLGEFVADGNQIGIFINQIGFGEHVGGVAVVLAGHHELHGRRADADDVAGLKWRGVDELAVETRAVGTVEIAHLESAVIDALDDTMRPAGPRIRNNQRVGRMPANGGARLIQLKVDLRGAHENFEIGTLHSQGILGDGIDLSFLTSSIATGHTTHATENAGYSLFAACAIATNDL